MPTRLRTRKPIPISRMIVTRAAQPPMTDQRFGVKASTNPRTRKNSSSPTATLREALTPRRTPQATAVLQLGSGPQTKGKSQPKVSRSRGRQNTKSYEPPTNNRGQLPITPKKAAKTRPVCQPRRVAIPPSRSPQQYAPTREKLRKRGGRVN